MGTAMRRSYTERRCGRRPERRPARVAVRAGAAGSAGVPGSVDRRPGVQRRLLDAERWRGLADRHRLRLARPGGAGPDGHQPADRPAGPARRGGRRRARPAPPAAHHPELDAGLGGGAVPGHSGRAGQPGGRAHPDLPARAGQRGQRPRLAGDHPRAGRRPGAVGGGGPQLGRVQHRPGGRPGHRRPDRGGRRPGGRVRAQRRVVPGRAGRAVALAAAAPGRPGRGRAGAGGDWGRGPLRALRPAAAGRAGPHGPVHPARQRPLGPAAGGGQGALGIGSVAGAVALPRLRRAVPIDRRLVGATCVFALATVALATLGSPLLVWLAMVAAGMAWLAILTSMNVATQTAVPRWVRARALAVYLLVFQGGLAAGSALWGVVAGRLGERVALLAAAASFGLGLLAALRWRLQGIGALDLTPSVRPEPVTAVDPDPDDGPVLVLVRYRIDPARAEEFATAMWAMRRVRRRDGAYRWGVFEDVADPGCFVETYVVRSWAEHLRQHERFTAEDLSVRDRVRSFHIGEDPPAVSHFIRPDAAIAQRRWVRWTRRHQGEPAQADDD